MAEVARGSSRLRAAALTGVAALAVTTGCAAQSARSDAGLQQPGGVETTAAPGHHPSHLAQAPTKGPAKGPANGPTQTWDRSGSTYDDTSGTGAAPPRSQTSVLTSLPGTRQAGCVDVGGHRDVRSGAVAMGDFATARAAYHHGGSAYDAPPLFFYVIPQSPTARSVTVTASRVGGTASSVHLTSRQVEQAAQWKYFPVHLVLPDAGTWRFRVTAADQQGCFVATFAR